MEFPMSSRVITERMKSLAVIVCCVLCGLAQFERTCAQTGDAAAASGDSQTLYPFVQDGKWGFIDSRGEWVIKPQFDRAMFPFQKDRVRVEQGKHWGYIDRQGNWLTKPEFTDPYFGAGSSGFEIVSIGKKSGLLSPSGKTILPAQYDEISLLHDRAFVRKKEKLGVFGFDGHWIKPLTIPWPKSREMPTATQSRALWFKEGRKWGLLSHDGSMLFRAQFLEHEMGRRESEEWDHPEGLDFKDGVAWVTIGKDYLLITDEGKVLFRRPLNGVSEWTSDVYVFTDSAGKKGLVSKDGEIVLAAQFSEIRPPSEGMAVVVQRHERKGQDGSTDTWWSYGYIDEGGKVVVESGVYAGPGASDGGQTELAPFREGLAPVWNSSPEGARTQTSAPCAGYIDRSGALVIPEQFYRTKPFSEGLGAVCERKDHGRGLSPDAGLWGYVDKAGVMVIAPQFNWTTPFCRGRAWVHKGRNWDGAEWALIDRTGKVLTEFIYKPPGRADAFGYPEDEQLEKTRWRGDLVVISTGNFQNGLATADGKVLVPPQFNRIGDFHDGVAVAIDSSHYPKFVTALITAEGKVLAYGEYTELTEFEGGVGWASKRFTDHKGPYRNEGWGLIDRSAKLLSGLKYVAPSWIFLPLGYTGSSAPGFCGALAPVALAEGYDPYKPDAPMTQSWGYMDRSGRIVAWHEGMPATASKIEPEVGASSRK